VNNKKGGIFYKIPTIKSLLKKDLTAKDAKFPQRTQSDTLVIQFFALFAGTLRSLRFKKPPNDFN